MDVKIISQKLIKPSIPTPPHLQNLSLSFIDQFTTPITVPLVFYYQPPQQHIDQTCTQLEKSLSQILTLYYPIAGRFIKDSNSIKCNDQGVQYSKALVNCPISQILESESIQLHDLECFVPDNQQQSATSPLLAIQINIFSCGGLAIGIRASHRFIDGYTFSMFMNGWTTTCQEGNIDNVIVPNFESSTLFPPRDISQPEAEPLLSTKSKITTKRFLFDWEKVSKLKEECKASTSEVLTAVIWRAINVVKAKQGKQRNFLLQIFFSLRGKSLKKIPENCCGNVLVLINVESEADERKMGLVDFVKQVTGAIRNTKMEFAKAMADGEDVFVSRVEEAWMNKAEQSKEEYDMFQISSFIKYPIYELDFGWGKPVWISFAHRDDLGSLLIARKDGIEAWVNMEEEDIGFLENDDCVTMLRKHVTRNGHCLPFCFSKM